MKKNRNLDLSSKFLEMGNALMIEGNNDKDYLILQSGTVLILLGGLMLDKEDMYEFMQLCSMYSAKKILDGIDDKSKGSLVEYLKKKGANETYESFIKRINKLRGDAGHTPLG
jgi:hypothetical protein